MTTNDGFEDRSNAKRDRLIALGIFLAALVPRGLSLGSFVTVDEAKWVYRSAQFLAALLRGDLAGTVVNLTPAVTTTWLGSIGLTAYYWLHRPAANFSEWLLSLPEFRTDLDVLLAVRWPMVLMMAAGIAVGYLLARHLLDRPTSIIFALLLALDPHFVSLSRVLGHDAPVGLFVGLSLLSFRTAMPPWSDAPVCYRWRDCGRWLSLSGFFAGLAWLSKSPAFFLLPFVGLVTLVRLIRRRTPAIHCMWHVVIWGLIAVLTFIVLWPAAWQSPLATPWAVIRNAFLSATDTVEAAAEGHWLVPDLGWLYYPVNAGFKFSILASLGLATWPVLLLTRHWRKLSLNERWAAFWLATFAGLFVLLMTLGGKRSARYLLPAWMSIYFLAAMGLRHWATLFRTWRQRRPSTSADSPTRGPALRRITAGVLFGGLLLLPMVYTYPYYFSYYNPLMGGPLTAPRLVKIGWGEGLDRVGRWLQQQPQPETLRVGSYYASALAPFFSGNINPVTAESLDYVVLYIKQTQSGEPSPSILRYYLSRPPAYTVHLAGIEYARVMPGPAMRPALTNQPAFDTGILPKPLAFRADQPYLPIGGQVGVEVLWLADASLPRAATRLTLQPLADLDAQPGSRSQVIWAQAEGRLERRPDGLVVSHYSLALPADLPRGDYGLLVDGRPLGSVAARLFGVPPLTAQVQADFDRQIALVGYDWDATTGDLTLVWRAAPRAWADYTVFVHLLDAGGQRVAGVDARPEPPTDGWAPDEVVTMTFASGSAYGSLLPPDLTAGQYRVAVGLYHPQTLQRLPLLDAAGKPAGDQYLLPLTIDR